jgi:hypothetical protein
MLLGNDTRAPFHKAGLASNYKRRYRRRLYQNQINKDLYRNYCDNITQVTYMSTNLNWIMDIRYIQ